MIRKWLSRSYQYSTITQVSLTQILQVFKGLVDVETWKIREKWVKKGI